MSDKGGSVETWVELIGVIVIGGVAGGLASYLLSSTSTSDDATKSTRLSWCSYTFVGIVAAFVVPLFLKLAQSALISDILNSQKPLSDTFENLLVLAGFCVLAGFSSRRFMESVSDRLYAMLKTTRAEMKQTRENAADAKQQASDAKITVEEMEENMPPPSRPTMRATATLTAIKDIELPSLTPPEVEILKTLIDRRFSRRTLMGIAKDSNKPPDTVRGILEKLKSKQLMTQFSSEQTKRELFEITARGLKVLENQP